VSQDSGAVWCKRGENLPENYSTGKVSSDKIGITKVEDSQAAEQKPWIWELDSSKKKAAFRGLEQVQNLEYCNCGRKGTSSSLKKGHQAERFEFPWHGHLTISSDEHNPVSYTCSAYIINNFVLITSANCVVRKDGKIVAASHVTAELLSVDDFWKGLKFPIDKIVVHPGYMENLRSSQHEIFANKYDIALLKLKTPITFKRKHYRPICLPELGEKIFLGNGTVGTSLVWSRLNTVEKKTSHRLLKDKIVVKDPHFCEIHFNTSSTTLCADYSSSKTGILEEDLGKGIFISSAKSSHMMQIGITSFRISDSIRGNSVELEYFTKIDRFVAFINYYSNEWGAAWCQRKFTFM